jgi:transcriptional regulator with XRE-family HTH domain
MITIEAVARFRWNPELGAKLKTLRTSQKLSRAALVKLVSENLTISIGKEGKGHLIPDRLTTKYIERLEIGDLASISLEALQALAKALGVRADDLLQAEETIVIFSKQST